MRTDGRSMPQEQALNVHAAEVTIDICIYIHINKYMAVRQICMYVYK
jgi:hypothetical protein